MKKNYKKIALLIVTLLIGAAAYGGFHINEIKGKGNLQGKKTSNEQSINKNTNSLEEEKNKSLNKKKEVKDRKFEGANLKYNDQPVPVLMYHSIGYEKGNELRVPKEAFREQMQYLKNNGYTTLSLNEVHNFLVNNKPIPNKSVAITLDDGYVDNYECAYPILKEFGFNATIFVITGNVDKDSSYINSKQIKEMDENGVYVESHTVNHDQLDVIPYDKQLQTLKSSKEFLESMLNRKATNIAYPFGKWNNDTIKAAKEAGYTMAVTTVGGWSQKSQDIYALDRVYISAKFGINEFERRITNPNYNK